MNCFVKRFTGFICFAAAFCGSLPAVSAEREKQSARRVLMVDSYASMDVWSENIRDGFRSILSEQDVKINYETYELAVRFQSGLNPAQADIEALRLKLASTRYDLIVTSNNAATDLFLTGTLPLPEGTPLIASAYSGNLQKAREQTGLNMTGVEIPLNLFDNVIYALKLLPATRKVVLVADATADGRVQKTLTKLLADSNRNVEVAFISGSEYSTPEMFAELKKLDGGAVIFFNSWGSTRDPEPEGSYTALPKIRRLCPNALIMGKYSCYMALGAEAGIQPSGFDHGRIAAELAVRIFSGERAGGIAAVQSPVRQVLDYAAVRRLGIGKKNIPPETVILNTPPGFWIVYKEGIILAGSLFAAGTVFTIFFLLRRRKAFNMVRAMFAALPVRVVVVDRKMNTLFFHVPDDPALAQALAQSAPGNLPIRDEQIHPCLEQARKVFADGRPRKIEFEWHKKWRHAEFYPLPKEVFKKDAVMWFSSDITALHEAHATVAQMAGRFRLTLESIGDGVIATDETGRVTLLNPVATRLTGYTQEEAAGKPLETIFNIVSYITGDPVPSPLKKAIDANAPVELANHTDLIAKDGTRRHIADCASPIHDEDGRIAGGVLVFRDVTADYEKRDRIQMTSAILTSVADIAKITYFSTDPAGITTFQSAPLPFDLTDLGIPWSRLLNRQTHTLDITHETQGAFYRLRAVQAQNEANGKNLIFGVIQNITDITRSERSARDSLSLLQAVMNNLPCYIFAKKVEDRFRYVMCNAAFERVVGHTAAEIIGKTDADFFPNPADTDQFLADDRTLAASGKFLDSKEHFLGADGATHTVHIMKDVITQSDGTRLLLGMGLDVTAQEASEQKTQKLLRQEQLIKACLETIVVEKTAAVMPALLQRIGQYAHATGCCIIRFEATGNTPATCTDHWFATPGPLPSHLSAITPAPHWRQRLSNRELIILGDIERDIAAPHPPGPTAQSPRPTLLHGLWVNTTFIGCLCLGYDRPRTFSAEDLQLMQTITHIVEIALGAIHAQSELERNEYQNRLILDNVSIPLFLFSPGMRIVSANRAARLLTGRTEEEILNSPCHETFCRATGIGPECQVKKVLADGQTHTRDLTVNGRELHIIACPITVRGTIIFVLECCIDMTAFNQNQRQLLTAMEAAQAADRAKTYFLATMSHELRTPLNAVIGFSEILQQQTATPAQQAEYLSAINLSGKTLLNLISDLLDLTRLEGGQISLTPCETELPPLIAEICAIFRPKLDEKHLTLTLQGLETIPCLLLDSQRIRQILLNLIGNAVKFTHRGGITLRAALENGTLALSVADTGIGITPEKQQTIFDPFVQGDQTRGNRVYEGSGLGLSISSRLARRMGGEITLQSTPGHGSTFTLTLRATPCPRPGNTPKTTPQPPALPPRTILLVDDVPMNLKVLEAMLRRLNAASIPATSAEEALALLEKHPVDLILTDLWMPGINGQQLAERIRANPAHSRLPIYAVTADSEASSNFDMTPFNGAFQKPISLKALTALLETL